MLSVQGDRHEQRVPHARPTSHCNEHLQAKKYGQKGRLWDTLWYTAASTMRFFFLCCEGGGKGRGQLGEEEEISGIGVHGVKFSKNQ